MKKEKGQAIVEFALVLPLFLVLVFMLILSSLLFADYMTLSNVARSSAREASLQGSSNYDKIRTTYKENTTLFTNLYQWPDDNSGFQFEPGDIDNSVRVVIRTNLNSQFPGVAFLDSVGVSLPAHYEIKYTVHDESGTSGS